MNTCFSQTFRAPPHIPTTVPWYLAKNFAFPSSDFSSLFPDGSPTPKSDINSSPSLPLSSLYPSFTSHSKGTPPPPYTPPPPRRRLPAKSRLCYRSHPLQKSFVLFTPDAPQNMLGLPCLQKECCETWGRIWVKFEKYLMWKIWWNYGGTTKHSTFWGEYNERVFRTTDRDRSNLSNRNPLFSGLRSGCSAAGRCTGTKWPQMVTTTILVKIALFRTGFSIHETKMDQNGPFWPKEVYFGPFRSANRTLASLFRSLFKTFPIHCVEA